MCPRFAFIYCKVFIIVQTLDCEAYDNSLYPILIRERTLQKCYEVL